MKAPHFDRPQPTPVSDLKSNFDSKSVVFVPSIVSTSLCDRAAAFLLSNEEAILSSHSKHARGLSTDIDLNGVARIKYFEFPLYENPYLYGEFINSNIITIVSALMNKPVRLVSCELHSRCAGGTPIPIHQDNAYYGLSNGDGLTVYIALNKQCPSSGGLIYYSNDKADEYNHVGSNFSGFSLTINDPHFDLNSHETLEYNYNSGDCTIHHSRSVHSAYAVPAHAQRALVLRLSFYAINESKIDGHDEWYRSMIFKNRNSTI